eukprot:CAMPEP_0172152726 /NCGR_PEP_ID=MMETSP1050-20130122/1017_1 /TAXON_ID=233186 /ORGANISM="Cryptomonas curvata, Strain CCAP979/52" /LENGTH=239 /DNA_ID=CAMNT_0012821119 /DNA_START=157 /DNA_END=873 /DNA_ORIENTATION=-
MIPTASAIVGQEKDNCPFDLWRLDLQNACRELNDTVPFLTSSWKSSVGLELNGLIIKHIISGSPAHQSSQLSEGDLILKVDHKQVTESNALEALDGFNIPGSSVIVSVQKAVTSQVVDVVLVRTALEIVAQGGLILDLLSNLKGRSADIGASELAIDKCLDYVFNILMENSVVSSRMAQNLYSLQSKASCILSIASQRISDLPTARAETGLTEAALAWTQQQDLGSTNPELAAANPGLP